MKRRGARGTGLTSVVGGMLVGLDEQLLRATPRAEILVKRGQSLRGLSAQGGTLEIGLPDDPIVLDAPDDPVGPDPTSSDPTASMSDLTD
jgi:hypothetical protein